MMLQGPAVSGAMTTIITTRAGKDLVSSLVAGLLTIGDRFGGALDGAAAEFTKALDSGLTPREFVDSMRKANKLSAVFFLSFVPPISDIILTLFDSVDSSWYWVCGLLALLSFSSLSPLLLLPLSAFPVPNSDLLHIYEQSQDKEQNQP